MDHVVCHGIPDEKKRLGNGDIINIDVTIVDGWHGIQVMFLVGDKVKIRLNLVQVTYDSMMQAIEIVKLARRLVISVMRSRPTLRIKGFRSYRISAVTGLVRFSIPHRHHAFRRAGTGPRLVEGMFFTIEPMINAGKYSAKILQDGWTAVTKDRSLSAQFEHSISVTADGFEIFTLSPNG